MEAKADVSRANEDGTTPLFIAAQNGHVDVIKTLVEARADVNRADEDGTTPLYIAAQEGHVAAVNTLLEANADVNRAEEDGTTPLYVAARNGHVDAIKALVAAKADINRARQGGATPLLIAAVKGHVDVIKALVEAKADVNCREESNGWTPLCIAAATGRADCVRALLAAGADATVRVSKLIGEETAAHRDVARLISVRDLDFSYVVDVAQDHVAPQLLHATLAQQPRGNDLLLREPTVRLPVPLLVRTVEKVVRPDGSVAVRQDAVLAARQVAFGRKYGAVMCDGPGLTVRSVSWARGEGADADHALQQGVWLAAASVKAAPGDRVPAEPPAGKSDEQLEALSQHTLGRVRAKQERIGEAMEAYGEALRLAKGGRWAADVESEWRALASEHLNEAVKYVSADWERCRRYLPMLPKSEVRDVAFLGKGKVEVYRVTLPDGRKAARKQLLESPVRSKWARRELAALRLIAHPNIVSLIGCMEDSVVMVLLELATENLGSYLSRAAGRVTDQEALRRERVAETRRIGSDVASGLAFLHQRGLAHRDLKPENVLVFGSSERTPVFKLCDFEYVRDVFDTHSTVVPYSAGWAAPETCEAHLKGRVPGSNEMLCSDVFSLGLLLFYCLTRERPIAESLRTAFQVHTHFEEQRRASPRCAHYSTARMDEILAPYEACAGDVATMIRQCLTWSTPASSDVPQPPQRPTLADVLACLGDGRQRLVQSP